MDNAIEAWGDRNRHYATREPGASAVHSDISWEQIVSRVAPKCEASVNRAVQLWNQKIRNQLTTEIGFQHRGRQVSVRVVDGLPAPLSGMLGHADGLALVALNQSLLRGVVDGTDFMDSVLENVIASDRNLLGTVQPIEIEHVRKTAKAWMLRANDHNLAQSLSQINEDVLGAYFFYRREIRIYWLAIGIFSALCDVPIESLTMVVLTHELAHAYSHLGYDIDGYDWPTRSFASTDIAIIEGLAQFYTEIVCRNLGDQIPEAERTFEALLKRQNDIYKTHRTWVRQDDRHSGEIVRVSLVECRRAGKTMHRHDFANTVNKRRFEIAGTGEPPLFG